MHACSNDVQKKDFYYDQRINQQTVASLCADEDALDPFFFSDAKSSEG